MRRWCHRLTFDQYIINPMGKSNAVFSQREMAKTMYTEKFDRVNLRENGNFYYQLFFDKGNDEFFCYIKIPSEAMEGFYYDVAIKFSTKDNGLRTSATLELYDVQFFSNDPAFVYTYANVFNKLGLFIPELKSKGSKKAFKNDPVERNQYQIPGYVKSLYFAYLYMKSHLLFVKNTYRAAGTPYSGAKLKALIMDTEKKLEERQQLEKDKALAKRKEKETKRKAEKQAADTAKHIKFVEDIPETKRVLGVKTAKKSKTTKKIGSVKKIK